MLKAIRKKIGHRINFNGRIGAQRIVGSTGATPTTTDHTDANFSGTRRISEICRSQQSDTHARDPLSRPLHKITPTQRRGRLVFLHIKNGYCRTLFVRTIRIIRNPAFLKNSTLSYSPPNSLQRRIENRSGTTEIQSNEPVTTKKTSIGKFDSSFLKKSNRDCQLQFPHIEPRKIGRIPRRRYYLRYFLLNKAQYPIPVPAQILDQLQTPQLSVPISSFTCRISKNRDHRNDPLFCPLKSGAQFRIRDHSKRTTESGHVVSLARRHQGNRFFRHLVTQTRHRNMRQIVENQIAMNLVRTNNDVPIEAKLRQSLQLVFAKNPSSRIVRMTKHEKPRLRRHRFLHRLPINPPITILTNKRHRNQRPLHPPRRTQKRRISRRRRHHRIPFSPDRATSDMNPGNETGQPDDPLRIDFPAISRLAHRHHALY